jgi:hypothetical protein
MNYMDVEAEDRGSKIHRNVDSNDLQHSMASETRKSQSEP